MYRVIQDAVHCSITKEIKIFSIKEDLNLNYINAKSLADFVLEINFNEENKNTEENAESILSKEPQPKCKDCGFNALHGPHI